MNEAEAVDRRGGDFEHPGERLWRRIDDHEERVRQTETRIASLEEKFKWSVDVAVAMRDDLRLIGSELKANTVGLNSLTTSNETAYKELTRRIETIVGIPSTIVKIILGFGGAGAVLYGVAKIIVFLGRGYT